MASWRSTRVPVLMDESPARPRLIRRPARAVAPRTGLAIALALCAIAITSPGCGLIPWDIPSRHVTAQIVDAETNQPVAGAAINLQRSVLCARLTRSAAVHDLPPLETTTDAAGRFELDAPAARPPSGCGAPGWSYRLRVLAPGYFPLNAKEDSCDDGTQRPLAFTTAALVPIRYAADREVYDRPNREILRRSRPELERDNPILEAAYARAQSMTATPLDAPGVFLSVPDATFASVAVFTVPGPSYVTLAKDERTGVIHRWTADGVEVGRQDGSGVRLIPGWQDIPAVERDHRLYLGHLAFEDLSGRRSWYPAPTDTATIASATQVRSGLLTLQNGSLVHYDLTDFIDTISKQHHPPRIGAGEPDQAVQLQDGHGPIECLTRMRGTNRLVMVAHVGAERAIFVTKPGASIAYQVPVPPHVLDAPVIACDASASTTSDAIYISQPGVGLRRLRIFLDQKQRPSKEVAQPVGPPTGSAHPDLPTRFVAIAASRATPAETDIGFLREVVYAVAGDGTVYRFTRDLQPDQRIALR